MNDKEFNEDAGSRSVKKKDLIVILVIAVLAAILLIVGLANRSDAKVSVSPAPAADVIAVIPGSADISEPKEAGLEENKVPAATGEGKTSSVTEEEISAAKAADEKSASRQDLSGYSETAMAAAEEYLAEYPSETYLLVTTVNGTYTPIPLTEDGSFRITRADGAENVIHVGKNSFYMESSNCDNQNCVGEGEVTLENMNTRILYNMVICLPHEIQLEMLLPDQAKEILVQIYQAQEEYEAYMAQYTGDVDDAA